MQASSTIGFDGRLAIERSERVRLGVNDGIANPLAMQTSKSETETECREAQVSRYLTYIKRRVGRKYVAFCSLSRPRSNQSHKVNIQINPRRILHHRSVTPTIKHNGPLRG